jgi:hypothetical protein
MFVTVIKLIGEYSNHLHWDLRPLMLAVKAEVFPSPQPSRQCSCFLLYVALAIAH